MSRKLALLTAGALAFVPKGLQAQEQAISVYFEPSRNQQLNNAITAALTQAPFVLHAQHIPGALVVDIPDRIGVDRTADGSTWTFTVTFTHDGVSLGQSVESCNEHKLSDCTEQLISDAKSAAGMGGN
ncbi:MAG TPA: hypothetical protein VGH23_04130 [Rhizomicrobium sp.]|jgi:hypothetical protein